MHLFARYRDTLQPRQHWPDRPLNYYDDQELQELVLMPFRVDRAWTTDNLAPTSLKSFSVDKGQCHPVGALIILL